VVGTYKVVVVVVGGAFVKRKAGMGLAKYMKLSRCGSFRVRRAKRRWRTVCRGGVEVGWWRVRGGCGGGVVAFTNAKWGGVW